MALRQLSGTVVIKEYPVFDAVLQCHYVQFLVRGRRAADALIEILYLVIARVYARPRVFGDTDLILMAPDWQAYTGVIILSVCVLQAGRGYFYCRQGAKLSIPGCISGSLAIYKNNKQ